jgi:hypothetical protein
MKSVKLKDGQIVSVIREWNWEENPQMKIYKDSTYKERLHEDFIDVELNGQLKTHKSNYPNPAESNYHQVFMTVCRKDVQIIEM